MECLYSKVCGLDVHKKTIVACIRIAKQEQIEEFIHTFGTTTNDILALRDWLKQHGVTHVAMESTGTYWKPIYYLLEDEFNVCLANAAHIKNVPGRKTDIKDCQWIAQLLMYGLIRGSFVPPKPIRRLRDLTRYRRSLINDRTRQIQRLHKVLEDAGIKLSSVASDIMGVSSQMMIKALISGTTDPIILAELAQGRLRKKIPELREALNGCFTEHHAFMATQILSMIDAIEERIQAISEQIEKEISPFQEQLDILDTIPGCDKQVCEDIIAEIGVYMQQFPTAGHLASWAGLCPGNNESAGMRKSGKTRKGNSWLRGALGEASTSASRKKGSYFAALYGRVKSRRGHQKAKVAVAHSMIVSIWHMLSKKEPYSELKVKDILKEREEAIKRNCIRKLKEIGYEVQLVAISKGENQSCSTFSE